MPIAQSYFISANMHFIRKCKSASGSPKFAFNHLGKLSGRERFGIFCKAQS